MQLQFVVKGHELDPSLGSVGDVGDLLARVGINDEFWGHSKIQNHLDLILLGKKFIKCIYLSFGIRIRSTVPP